MVKSKSLKFWVLLAIGGLALGVEPGWGRILINNSDRDFYSWVNRELDSIKNGRRGVACQALLQQLETSQSTTTIRPLTRNEKTWHPNDHKGIRSHVIPRDVLVRGAARTQPTAALIYLHPSRINPKLSTFKLGTFVSLLAEASDLNDGKFSGDYVEREKRFAFYRNAWRDSFGLPLLDRTGSIDTSEYERAKNLNLITDEWVSLFPLLNPEELVGEKYTPFTDISESRELIIDPERAVRDTLYFGQYGQGANFVRVMAVNPIWVRLRYGQERDGTFKIYEGKFRRAEGELKIPITANGADFGPLLDQSKLIASGNVDPESENYSDLWLNEIPGVN